MSKPTRKEIDAQLDAMAEGSVDFHGREDLAERLAAGRPLRVKLGMDPSAPDLHLGHTVVLLKLRRFQELGHLPIFLVGDFTARIGDPSGRKKTRPALDDDEVRRNAATYVDQVGRLLDVERAELRMNNEWMDAMTPGDIVRLTSCYTVARLLERDDFHKRYAAGDPISVHEFLYPFVQAYDSVALRADVELGGTDQTFNLLMGREIQRAYGQPPQAVITHPLLVGTDGSEKMSKSVGNTVALTDAPEDVYGRTMSISDALMLDWIELLSAGAWQDLERDARAVRAGGGDPFALKHALAARVVERFHGADAARAAAEHFARVVQRGQRPEAVEETTLAAGPDGLGLLEALAGAGLAGSNSEARRLVAQGAVRLDGERVRDANLRLDGPGPHLLQVGKRRYARVRVA